MTDRELLELAARAAGYWSGEFACVDNLPHLGWNPLTDDGDALRLASRLCLLVNIDCGYTRVSDASGRQTYERTHGIAATRRAIVRAAAEIGRAME